MPYVKKINNPSKNHSKEKEIKYRRKLGNIVDELHWKVIDYPTSKYKVIVISDLGVKSITSNMKSVLPYHSYQVLYDGYNQM